MIAIANDVYLLRYYNVRASVLLIQLRGNFQARLFTKMHFTSIVRTVLVPIQHDCHEIVKLICHDAQIQDTWHLLAIAL